MLETLNTKSAIYTYTNKWGWDTVTLGECDNAELVANGIEFVVWNHATGSPTYHQDRWEAELHAELLATQYREYAVEHTCAESPEIKHRKGFVRGGHFAGLPVSFENGVAGVWLFERFTPLS